MRGFRLSLVLAVLCAAATAQESIVAGCDPADWTAARLGRDGLLRAVGLGDETFIVVTGGALVSACSPDLVSGTISLTMLDAAGVDVVNLAHRDLVGDPGRLAPAIGKTRPECISASFRLPEGTDTPWKPFVVVERGGKKVAFVGVAERSAAMELPESGVIAGLRYTEPEEAIRTALAALEGKADRVVLLADAPLSRVARWVEGFDAAFVSARGGVSALPTGGKLSTAPAGGRAWAVAGSGASRRILLVEPGQDSPAYSEAARRFGVSESNIELREPSGEGPAATAALPALDPGKVHSTRIAGSNRAATLTVKSIGLLDGFGGRSAPEGHRFLVVQTSWENILTPALLRKQLVPVAYQIPKLSDHLYCVVDGCVVLERADTAGLAGVLGWAALSLPLPGSKAAGRLLFLVPSWLNLGDVQLRHYDYSHGHVFLRLVGERRLRSGSIGELRSNRVLEAGVFGFARVRELDGRRAPDGMTFAVAVLRARSRFTFEADATAFDPKAKAGDRLRIGTVADWKETRRYLQAVVDGEYAYGLEPETRLPGAPRFLPDIMTGARAVFLIPERCTSLELRCDFPNAKPPDGEVFHPEPLVFPLEGERPELPEREALLTIDDEVLDVRITGQRAVAEFAGEAAGAGKSFLVWDVAVRPTSGKGEIFQTRKQLQYAAADGSKLGLDEVSGRGPRRSVDLLWLPKGERRSFQAVFRIPETETKPRLAYQGVSMAEVFELPALAAAPAAAVGGQPPPPPPPKPAPGPAAEPVERPANVPALAGQPVPGFRPVAAEGDGFEFSVLDARVAKECKGEKHDKGLSFLHLVVRWRMTEGAEEWTSGNIGYALHLHRRGRFVEEVWKDSWGEKEGFLPSYVTLNAKKREFVSKIAFAVPEETLEGSALIYLPPRKAAAVVLPVAAPGREEPLPVLARDGNAAFDLTVHGFVEPGEGAAKAIEGYEAKQKKLIALRVSAVANGKRLQLDGLDKRWPLIAGDDFPCRSYLWAYGAKVGRWPLWRNRHTLLPGVRDHGILLFAIPDDELALRLEAHHPRLRGPDGKDVKKPVLSLPIRKGGVRALPEPLATTRENGWEVRILGLRTHRYRDYFQLVVDVWLRAPDGPKGREFSSGDIHVFDQGNRQQSQRSDDLLPFGNQARTYLPPGMPRRYEARYHLTEPGNHLWLRVPHACPSSVVRLPNPWVAWERKEIAARQPLSVTKWQKGKLPYEPAPLFPEPEPKGIEGVGLTGKQVNEAIRKGAAYLMKKFAGGFRKDTDEHSLAILALLHSGEIQKNPELYAKAIEYLEQRKLSQSYDAALTLMGLAHVDPERYRPRIRKIAQSLIDGQSKKGPWSYINKYVRKVEPEAAPAAAGDEEEAEGGIEIVGGEPIPGWPGTEEKVEDVTLKPTQAITATGGDNSCSQYGVLGLQTAGRVGVKAAAETWERAAGWFVKAHNPGRGWGYGSGGASTGSMTTAGLAGLAVARHNLGGKPEAAERALRDGVDWLARHYALDANPGSSGWHFYYLYGLERAGRLLGKEFFGPYEWYAEGAKYLVGNQNPDGSWLGTCGHKDDVLDTSFALLFLTKATEKLGEEKKEAKTGPGELTLEASGLGGSVVFILDASGSMAANLGAETRFDAARRVVVEVLTGSGAGLDVALRVYGHRHRANRPEADKDSELVVGFGPADRPELQAALAKLRCRGKTPLTFSVLESLKDLQKAENKKRRVILLTDGMESDRRAKPMDAAAAVKAAGARLDVVCLCMDSTELLERMATAGGGACYSANDAQELLDAFTVAVVGGAPFRVKTPEGKVVFEGKSGDKAKLPAGPYVVEVDLPGKPQTVEAWVHQDRLTTLRVRAGG